MITLRFDGDAVADLVEDAFSTDAHIPTFGQTIDRFCALHGLDANAFDFGDHTVREEFSAWRRADEQDLRSYPAQLHFVKDDGIYLLSNAAHGHAERPRLVVYAQGYAPPAQDASVEERLAFFDTVRNAVGGDDFVEGLDIAAEMPQTLRRPGATYCIDVEEDSLATYIEVSD
jgi:Protein of unknown function (DUF3085)